MNIPDNHLRSSGHTLMELVAAMAASTVLLAGLGSVMMIARQIAYTPTAAVQRTKSADAVNQIAEELRYATLVIQHTPQILEFVIADRNADGAAEKIRYEWSGVPGDPLYKKVNAAPALAILSSVDAFEVSFQLKSKTATLRTTVDSAEQLLLSNTSVADQGDRLISATAYSAQQINPSSLTPPANAICWNATKFQFYGSKDDSGTSVMVQLRTTGEPNDSPTNHALGEKSVPESSLGGGDDWCPSTPAAFPNPIRDLAFHRRYALVLAGQGSGNALRFVYRNAAGGVLESNDAGASWQFMTNRQVFYRLWGTYTTPGTTYNVTRNYVSHVGLVLQSGAEAHSRVDARIPLASLPELLSAHWRADFSANPTTINANGDSALDWVLAGGGAFNVSTLINGVWHASGALETRPLSDFITTTFVDVSCRNTGVGGNGAVVRINADRQGGQYAPLLVYVQRQADGTQALTLFGKTSDAATKQLFTRTRLPNGFVRFRLTILPQNNVVNLQINDEDQGTFTYPTYAPASTTDRFLTLYADTSTAEFDYVDVRTATN